jgi:glycerol-3-phosphate dehydrogenase (NAD(P)+)
VKVAVVGAGAWGTALSRLLVNAGHEVVLWAFEAEVVESIRARRVNDPYLPGITLPGGVRVTGRIEEAVAGRDLIVSVSPSHVVRPVMRAAAPAIEGAPIVVSATKGIENETFLRMSEVLREVLPARLHARLAVLSGPSFAREVAADFPTAVVVASEGEEVARAVQAAFSTDRFRVYTSDDMTGVELGGALKNVIALAAGASDGLGFGHNARAALITRGLHEIGRLTIKLGGHPLTMAGLAGMGDLVLTCTGELSRNRTVGFEVGRGRALKDVLAGMRAVAEGVNTAHAAFSLARRAGVEMPITETVHRALSEGLPARDAVGVLMGRALRPERDA